VKIAIEKSKHESIFPELFFLSLSLLFLDIRSSSKLKIYVLEEEGRRREYCP